MKALFKESTGFKITPSGAVNCRIIYCCESLYTMQGINYRSEQILQAYISTQNCEKSTGSMEILPKRLTRLQSFTNSDSGITKLLKQTVDENKSNPEKIIV